ncbi:MAG TPA: AAC(3) family N-acetyltransferase [candidate division Zixibacteria bacterium]|nr:AAC(3) family N-acetyltransferase [candidate division Zixibacteria bacterium]
MSYWKKEKKIVEQTKSPITISSLTRDFKRIGIKQGDVIIVHSSMSKLGWTVGGPITVIDALINTIKEDGTIVMPTMSTGNTDPKNWNYPSVPKEWWDIIREEMPPYRPAITPTRGMGRIPETFLKYPNVIRSMHPQCSFAAWGKEAHYIIEEHSLDETFGDRSPLGKLYQMNAKILLLGVKHDNNTSLHYAEWKAKIPNQPVVDFGGALLENGKRVWKKWKDLDYDSEDFGKLGIAFEKSFKNQPSIIGQAKSSLHMMREVVDFGVKWLKANRKY